MIKFIGLYAASISTAVAYIVMAIYRSIDLRKFVKIKYDKKLILIIVIFFITSILFYYQDNVFFKIINMFIAIVYLIVINRHLLFAVKKKIIRKP